MKIVQIIKDEFVAFLDTLRHFWCLIFDIDAFIKEARSRPTKTKESDEDNLAKNSKTLRFHILRALRIIGYALFLAIMMRYLIVNILSWHIPPIWLTALRSLGYLLILWGVLSPIGYKIQTWNGDTLPEIVDEEWHKFWYLFGIIFILFSYLAEI